MASGRHEEQTRQGERRAPRKFWSRGTEFRVGRSVTPAPSKPHQHSVVISAAGKGRPSASSVLWATLARDDRAPAHVEDVLHSALVADAPLPSLQSHQLTPRPPIMPALVQDYPRFDVEEKLAELSTSDKVRLLGGKVRRSNDRPHKPAFG